MWFVVGLIAGMIIGALIQMCRAASKADDAMDQEAATRNTRLQQQ